MTEITLKNDPKQELPESAPLGEGKFAGWIAFFVSQLKNLINKLATSHLVRPILSALV
ncbi:MULTISPECIES: hypothetical protein [Raoultella]|uniref:Uncharacterized protein n=1 Tax=Raoultella terrigena TaxID=577 RepID=A0AAQ0BN05_RAOTE|nr:MULTISPECIES: hypothetical protein [Raoultella]MCE9896839.1 hypothetical protein [Raoultella terrigena]MCS4274446.1 hypothetical protein [Raoultella sp. BIGb0132]MCS4291439.1 hypothetical protein [Raoultella terrigena]MEB7597850.1 hypothetical protein [Raoultella terrigena]MEB8192051.1 hypothetical protein [Raoultella terrigena]